MNRLRSLAAFSYDLVVGDDPVVAAGVVITLALTAAVAATPVSAWWLPVLAVPVLIGIGLVRATTRGRLPSSHPTEPLR